MAYLNVLDTSDPDGMSLREIQARRLKENTRKAREEKCRCTEEMRAAYEGMSRTHEHNEEEELLGVNTGVLRSQLQIEAEGQRLREEAIC